MIVQKLRQLLAQAFVTLAFMTQHDRTLEQRVLEFLRQFAPEIGGRRSEDKKETRGVLVDGRWCWHAQSSHRFAKVADRISPGNPAMSASPKQICLALD
jgi:hypothetical protein